MGNNYSGGDDQWPLTLVKVRQLLIRCKSDKRCISSGLSVISYTTLDDGSQKETSVRKTASYNPNWTCHICGVKGHRHMEFPKKKKWYKFRH